MSKQLNVQELIDLLQAVPDKTALVTTEGCDCYGLAGSVSFTPAQNDPTSKKKHAADVCIDRATE